MTTGTAELTCATCGKPMRKRDKSLPQGQARCHECRRQNPEPRRATPKKDARKRKPYGSKRGTCAGCGSTIWLGRGSLPDGQAGCLQRRRDYPAHERHAMVCEECGKEFRRAKRGYRFCSRECTGRWQSRRMQVRNPDDHRVHRNARENAAPGLNKTQRGALRAKWTRQGKPCAYCGAEADTIDHVMPLVRGGTNYEGNLVPACRRCNSSKSGKTIIEWRHGVSLGQVRDAPEWLGKPKAAPKEPKPRPEPVPHECPICGTPTTRRKYCGDTCLAEATRRTARDYYRLRVGLPVDLNQPTSKWAA